MNIKYQSLIEEFLKNYYEDKKNCYNYKKELHGLVFVFLPVSVLKDEFDLSPYQQRKILLDMEAKSMISVRFGHARKRYFAVLPNSIKDIKNKIKKQVDMINNIDELVKFDIYIKANVGDYDE